MDLGTGLAENLAFDVDDDMDQEDREALDSDAERTVDEELGLEHDETDGKHPHLLWKSPYSSWVYCSTYAYCPIIFAVAE